MTSVAGFLKFHPNIELITAPAFSRINEIARCEIKSGVRD